MKQLYLLELICLENQDNYEENADDNNNGAFGNNNSNKNNDATTSGWEMETAQRKHQEKGKQLAKQRN